MTTQRYTFAILFLAGAAALHASPIVTLQPGGAISGAPGDTIGWGFRMTPDPQYAVSVIGTFLASETNPSLGSYTDIISYAGGPSQSLLNPGAQPWIENFAFNADPSLATGLGSYQINPGAQIGATDSGNIVLEYELSTVSGPCAGCYVSSGTLDIPFNVTTTAEVVTPEPNMMGVLFAGLAALVFSRWLARR